MTWEEPPLPEMPTPPKKAVRETKPEPVRTEPEWRKHTHANRVHCDECLVECVDKARTYPWQSSWIRTDTDDSKTLLCYQHAAQYRDAPKAARNHQKKGSRP